MTLDRTNMADVATRMTRRIGTVLLCFAAACHGDSKTTATTTPVGKAGGSGTQSMHDAPDPTGGPVGGGGGGNTPGNPGGGGGGGGPVVGNDPGGPPLPVAPPEGPPIIAPNFDVDPTQAKSAVDQHLAVARAALSAPTPDADAALREARAALAIDATSLDAASMTAFAYYHKKLYDTGELILDDVFKRPAAKQNANIFYVYGLIYDHTNRPAQAEVAFSTAVQLNPNFPSALVNVGVHQLQNQQYAAAQTTFEKLTGQFNRNDAVTLTSLGSAYRGRSAEYPATASEHDQFIRQADAAYKRATQANASYGPAFYNLGLLYLDNAPFPGISDDLVRLQSAKDFFDKYKATAGFDLKLIGDRQKDVDKAIKKAQKKAQKKPAAAANP